MQEAYEEISGCPEEIMYPILDDIEINSTNTKDSETTVISESIRNQTITCNANNRNQEEAFQEANNFVCSEMLDSNWVSNETGITGVNDKVSSIYIKIKISQLTFQNIGINLLSYIVQYCNCFMLFKLEFVFVKNRLEIVYKIVID